MKYYIVWTDWNHGVEVEEADEEKDVEERVSQLLHDFEKENQGGDLIGIFYGEKKEYEVVKLVDAIKIKE